MKCKVRILGEGSGDLVIGIVILEWYWRFYEVFNRVWKSFNCRDIFQEIKIGYWVQRNKGEIVMFQMVGNKIQLLLQ